MKVTALEVPLEVVMVTCADGEPVDVGTVTVQVFCAGQLVEATWPLNVATMWPFVLRKFEPATRTDSPAGPLEGSSAEITGAPPRASGGVVLVVVPFDDGDVAAGDPPPDVDGCGWCELPAWLGVTTEDVVAARGEPLPLASDTARPIAATTSSTATTATAAMSQRSSCRAPPMLGVEEGPRAGESGGRG